MSDLLAVKFRCAKCLVTRFFVSFMTFFVLAGCATIEKGVDSTLGDRDRRKLQSYSRERTAEYVAGAAVAGAAVAATANCIKNKLAGKACRENAGTAIVVGGVLGGASGYVIAIQTEKFDSDAARLDALVKGAQLELDAAIQAREATANLVSKFNQQLATLSAQANSSSDAKQKLKKEISQSKKDIQSIEKSIKRIDEQTMALQTELKKNSNVQQGKELSTVVARLREEKQKLQREIDLFAGAVGEAEGIVS